jgi:hypothetical protein
MRETNCYYDGFLEDILRLVDIVGNPSNGRFSDNDIRGIQWAVKRILERSSSAMDISSMNKLISFNAQ